MAEDPSSPETKLFAAPEKAREVAQLGQFLICAKIGEGGMGAVYKAVQTSLNRPVAVKLLPESLSRNKAFVDRFHREARAAAVLNHPNLIQVYDAGEQEGMHYFAMEFIEGESLAAKVSREGALPEETAIAAAMCVAAALNHAWTKAKLIHRDIKPDNIMLTSEGMVKVCDLGLAKSVGHDSNLTVTGTMMGTPHFIAPEQARGEKDVDTRADIYSLGASLYYLVTGKPPFEAESSMAILYKHCNDPLPDPRKLNPKLSAGFIQVLTRMTAKDPADRYQDMAELYEDLERIHQGITPTAVALPPGKSVIERSPVADAEAKLKTLQRRLRNWRIVGTVSLLIISLVVLGVWNSVKHRSSGSTAGIAATSDIKPTPSVSTPTPVDVKPPSSPNLATVPDIEMPKETFSAPPAPPTTAHTAPIMSTSQKQMLRERVEKWISSQKSDLAKRKAELTRVEEAADRQRKADRTRAEALLVAENGYRDFLKSWEPLVAAHNYTKANTEALDALANEKFAPIKSRFESHLAMGKSLLEAEETLFQSWPGALKGKPLTLNGFAGTVSGGDRNTIILDQQTAYGTTSKKVRLVDLKFPERLVLFQKAMDPANHKPSVSLNLGLMALAEKQSKLANDYFNHAQQLDADKTIKQSVRQFRDLEAAMDHAVAESAAAAALEHLNKLVHSGRWIDVGKALDPFTKQFETTSTLKHALYRLQEVRDMIIDNPSCAIDLRADLALDQLKQDVETQDWKHGQHLVQKIAQDFKSVPVVVNHWAEFDGWRSQTESHATTNNDTGGKLLMPALRKQVTSEGGSIVPFTTFRNRQLSENIENRIHDGDGVELDDGFYVWKSTPARLKNISIFAKPGTAPKIVFPGSEAQMHLTEANGCWRFANICFVSWPEGLGGLANTPFALEHGGHAEFQECAFTARGTVPSLFRCGIGSELTLRNCLLWSENREIELSNARHVTLRHCTCFGNSLFWFKEPALPEKPCEVSMGNNLMLFNASWGVAGEGNPVPNHALTPPELLKRIDFTDSHHNVILLATPTTMEAWVAEFDKQPNLKNIVAPWDHDPRLAEIDDHHRLEPDCFAAHAAKDGYAVGTRWPDEFFGKVWQFLAGKSENRSENRPELRPENRPEGRPERPDGPKWGHRKELLNPK